ncbi:hypothetical protein L596_009424 [Steinernema carpocapsae]|uniref:Uncharacterized protein n=1 Tax=Steinernema carpocapsae TaxID=34508 RepID=A0A4U5PFA9_STECR|nr:hypothetical protein L596_009424 [Steinernema carpocapsae]
MGVVFLPSKPDQTSVILLVLRCQYKRKTLNSVYKSFQVPLRKLLNKPLHCKAIWLPAYLTVMQEAWPLGGGANDADEQTRQYEMTCGKNTI